MESSTGGSRGEENTEWDRKPWLKQVTLRSTVIGLLIGSLVLVSNFQFGLQTGWVSMMSLPSALLACAIFKQVWPIIFPNDSEFSDVENVYVQSIAVAVGTGPLAYGFVGVVPAIEKFLTDEESGGTRVKGEDFSLNELLMWSSALAFFGIFFAVPIRKQVIVREKLPFPSGSATATLISVLNGSEILQEVTTKELVEMKERRLREYAEVLCSDEEENVCEGSPLMHGSSYTHGSRSASSNSGSIAENSNRLVPSISKGVPTYKENVSVLMKTFAASALYTVTSYFIPAVKSIPVFGRYAADVYLWSIEPSPAYVGQGIIMGLATVSYMLLGCILGWAVLAPLARYYRWVDPEADVHDWENGFQGWIIWTSLSVMVVDSVVGFIVFTVRSIVKFILLDDKMEMFNSVLDDSIQSMLLEEERVLNDARGRHENTVKLVSTEIDHDVDSKHLVTYTTVLSGLVVSFILCVIVMIYLFGIDIIPLYSIVSALIIASFLSILAVRALGETDLNPVSGIGKLSQLIFALIIPNSHKGSVLLNLVAGGVAEAGAQQAGDLMQDLKTGHLLGASPKAQFIAQSIGAAWSIVLSSVVYRLYNKIYDIPNQQFRIPTAVVWIDCARLVTGKNLPDKALECSLVLGSIFAVLSLVKNCLREKGYKWLIWIPSGVAVGVGIYNTPSFTIERFAGGMLAHIWLRSHRGNPDAKTKMIVFSSGLVLGEGIFSIVNMFFTSIGVPHF
ncbi:unnamed protein product [Kluyveromyces dobzhanskii CBS 2104]|uniref:WGS project CCBQ000000000 data, contig 00015 n=1 Tax=Kluyveromyces dobzhanskii CBS 2104 TaxID=1427455 RepID=A0A0A8LAA2_9SACH|nr:unnamed protein product [Kluyveromyces dobzhanskii CBS 2104]